jgi:hypothetical protein
LHVLTLERLLSSGVLVLATHCGQLRRGEDLGEPHSLEATRRRRGAPRRTSEAAMMRLYHSVLLVQFRVLSLELTVFMSSLVLLQIQFASSALLRQRVDFGEPQSLTKDHILSFISSKKDL